MLLLATGLAKEALPEEPASRRQIPAACAFVIDSEFFTICVAVRLPPAATGHQIARARHAADLLAGAGDQQSAAASLAVVGDVDRFARRRTDPASSRHGAAPVD